MCAYWPMYQYWDFFFLLPNMDISTGPKNLVVVGLELNSTYSKISLYSMLSSRFCRLGLALRIALM